MASIKRQITDFTLLTASNHFGVRAMRPDVVLPDKLPRLIPSSEGCR
jgi:hypothetical protein